MIIVYNAAEIKKTSFTVKQNEVICGVKLKCMTLVTPFPHLGQNFIAIIVLSINIITIIIVIIITSTFIVIMQMWPCNLTDKKLFKFLEDFEYVFQKHQSFIMTVSGCKTATVKALNIAILRSRSLYNTTASFRLHLWCFHFLLNFILVLHYYNSLTFSPEKKRTYATVSIILFIIYKETTT